MNISPYSRLKLTESQLNQTSGTHTLNKSGIVG